MNSISQNKTRENAPSNSTMEAVSNLETVTDPAPSNEPIQITQFIDDSAKQTASLPEYNVPSQDVLSGASESRMHNIIDVLERPVKIAEQLWSSSDAFDTELKTWKFPDALLSEANNLVDKISHFAFLRASIEIRFVVNTNTFQQGRLLAWFSPYGETAQIGARADVNTFLAAKSVFPRIILDAGTGNVGELTVPYVSYLTHYDLARGLGTLGDVRLTVINPLKSAGGATDAYISVFARFKDVHLEIPTAVPNNLGEAASTLNLFRQYTKQNKMSFQRLKNMLTEVPKAQVGEDVCQSSSGLISSTADTISRTATMGSSLPIVGRYLAPLSWMASAVSRVASTFGYSKPANLISTNRMLQVPGFGFTNSDGNDTSLLLAGSCENKIGARDDVFGSGKDEMDIAYVVQHEAYLDQFNWTTAQSPETILFETVVSPGATKARNNNGVIVYDSTPLAYVASMFRYWRGSIKFKIQATKTAYHSGRLRISFIPGGTIGSPGYDVNQGYSEIVDLKTSDEISMSIPFVSNTIWKKTLIEQYDEPSNYAPSTGILRVEVLNSLRAPASVSQDVAVNIWISGGDDIHFAIPDFGNYVPVVANSLSSFDILEMPRAQVMGNFQDSGFNATMESKNEMFKSPQMSKIDADALAIGEFFDNLRPLTRRFGRDTTIREQRLRPLGVTTNYFKDVTSADDVSPLVSMTPVDYISFLYRFYRGGKRFKYVLKNLTTGTTAPTSLDMLTTTLHAVLDPGISVPAQSYTVVDNLVGSGNRVDGLLGGGFHHIVDSLNNRFLEVTTPYFSNTHVSLIRSPGTSLLDGEFGDTTSLLYFFFDGLNANFRNIDVLKAGSDDFDMGWMVGPPRLARRPLTNNTTNVNFTAATIGTPVDGIYPITGATVTPLPADGNYNFVNGPGVSTVYGTTNGNATPFTIVVVASALVSIDFKENGSPSGTFLAPETTLNLQELGTVELEYI